ncbi:hypothetical protein VCRA2110O135_10366 [Vibrio crassostreae]|nr:hypothetical protein VCRA2110O135_10366 [Vibrio crassostreae]
MKRHENCLQTKDIAGIDQQLNVFGRICDAATKQSYLSPDQLILTTSFKLPKTDNFFFNELSQTSVISLSKSQ